MLGRIFIEVEMLAHDRLRHPQYLGTGPVIRILASIPQISNTVTLTPILTCFVGAQINVKYCHHVSIQLGTDTFIL
jgi:hypothetical protein